MLARPLQLSVQGTVLFVDADRSGCTAPDHRVWQLGPRVDFRSDILAAFPVV